MNQTFTNVADGSISNDGSLPQAPVPGVGAFYNIEEVTGGPGTLASITPDVAFVMSGTTTTYTINFIGSTLVPVSTTTGTMATNIPKTTTSTSPPTSVAATLTTSLPAELKPGAITVNATLDGSPWPASGTGLVNFNVIGTSAFSGTSVPQTYYEPAGSYTIAYAGLGPNATFVNTTSSATQTLTGGSAIIFTLNFKSKPVDTGRITVNATLNGTPWTAGSVNFTLTQQSGGSQTYSGTSVSSTYNGVPVGNYLVAYVSGGPTGGAPTSITSSATQPVTASGTTTFTLNWDKVAPTTGAIIVNGAQNGVPWNGSVNFTLTQVSGGSQTYSGTSVSSTYNSVPVGNYLVAYVSGGPTGGAPTSITNAATQTVNAGNTTIFTLNWDKVAPTTGTIVVNGAQNGVAWNGSVNFNVTGTSPFSGALVSQTFTTYPIGTYTIAWVSGGPTGGAPTSITSAATQSLTGGGTITFTMNWDGVAGRTGTIIVNATRTGAAGAMPYSGPVNFTVTQQSGGSQTYSGTSVSSTYNGVPVGNYIVTWVSGGPSGGAPVTITAMQSLTAGGTITFVMGW